MTASPEELPRLGRYQVINKIAAGGMAEVFLAKAVGAMGFQRLVAVKLIHANFTRDQEFVKMFIDEARIAMHLHHRNIVQVFDLDRANDTYFIAMEFVHGVNLYDLYERIASKHRWIEPPMALYLIAEVCKGLHFAHTRRGPDGRPLGIVHRDISPQNVLLSFEGEVKITDFGIATAAERLHQTAAGIVKGKYAYMAPERLQEKPTDGRVDVFSAGVLLYEMLVGENPFAGQSAVDTIENVLNKKIIPPSERGAPVSAQLDRITLKALARNPAERFASAQELADAVTEYALELTHARKDMAAGDNALGTLLAELFPEKAKRPPVAADPKSFSLPGVGGGVSVATIDETDPPPQHRPVQKRNGRLAELDVTQEDETSEGPPAARDPADSGDTDEPTVLRMTPMSDIEALGLPKVSKPSRQPQPSYAELDEAELAAHPTIGPFHAPGQDDRSLPTPITPLSSDDIDKTAPTELPSMMPPVRKPVVAAVEPRSTDPSGPPDDMDSYAATIQSANGLDTISDIDSAGMPPPAVIVPPVVVPQAPPSQPYVSNTPSTPLVRPVQSASARDFGRQPMYTPPGQPSHAPPPGYGLQQPSYSQPGGHGQSYPPVSGSHDLVVPVGSSPDLGSQSSLTPGRIGIPPRTSTIIAGLLLVIAALVVLAAVLVARGRDSTVSSPVVVKVTTEPPGASVEIDGELQKGVTPLDKAMMSGERHKFSVQLEGYRPAEIEQVLNAIEGGSTVVHFQLEALVTQGSITVQATPPEAEIFVDNVARGTGTVTVGGLPLGRELVIRVEAKGYKTIEQPITLDSEARDITMPIVLARGKNAPGGNNNNNNNPAQPAARTRKVQLTTEYGTWANVYYNKRWLGTTPLYETLPVGDIQLRVVNETLKLDRLITVHIPESGSEQVVLPLR